MTKTSMLGVIVLSFLLTGCVVKPTDDVKQDERTTQVSKKKGKPSLESSPNESTEETNSKNETTTSEEKEDAVEVMAIGSDTYGFVDIPKDWMSFQDLAGGDSIQYTDGTAINIVTLNGYDAKKLEISKITDDTVEDLASGFAYTIEENPELKSIEGEITEVAGFEAYHINAVLKNGLVLRVWVFRPEDDRIAYIAMEGSSEVVDEMSKMITESWRKTKDKR